MQQQRQRAFFGGTQSTVEAPAISRTVDERLAFLRRVYGWMFAGVLATVMGIAIAVNSASP